MRIRRTAAAVFLYISALLGAGFATGRELYAYFFRFGILSGAVGLLAAALLFGLSAFKTLKAARLYRIDSCSGLFELIFGKKNGRILGIISLFFFLMLFSAMAAASGEILHGITGMEKIIGNAALCIFCFAALCCGTTSAEGLSAALCPLMVIGCCVLGLTSDKTPEITAFDSGVLPHAVIYVSYNLLTSTAVLCTQTEMTGRESAAAAVLIALIIFISGLFGGVLTLNSPSALPIYAAVKHSTPKRIIYLVILISAVITTALGNAYCLMPYTGAGIICAAGFLLSLIGFDILVEKIYFIFGIIGCGLLGALLIMPCKNNASSADTNIP